jgi:hypothetical protein
MARSIRSYFAGLSRSTLLLAAASLFADISTEMLYPVLPVFLTQTRTGHYYGHCGDGVELHPDLVEHPPKQV